MRSLTLTLLYTVAFVAIWGGYTYGAGEGMRPEERSTIRRASVRPVERRVLHPCFFIGRPRVGDDKACQAFGGIRLARWETECEPDPSCTKLPDGTDFAKP